MTNDFQAFKQSGFEFVQHRHFERLFLTIGKQPELPTLPRRH